MTVDEQHAAVGSNHDFTNFPYIVAVVLAMHRPHGCNV